MNDGKEVLLEMIFEGGDRDIMMQKMTNEQFVDSVLMPLWGELKISSALGSVVGECMRRLRGEAPHMLIEEQYVDELFGKKGDSK